MSNDVKADAVILAGGFGTRLRSVVSDVPKVLAPVNGRPFLDILIDRLRQSGRVSRIALALGYMADRVIEHYRGHPLGSDLRFFVEEQPLGTGGAAHAAGAMTTSTDVFVLNGDSYIDIDVGGMLAAHVGMSDRVTIALRQVEDTSRYGRVDVDEGGRVERFLEKSQATGPGWINAGVYVFRRSILDSLPPGTLSMEHDVFPELCTQRRLYGFFYDGKFIDIGVPESYFAATEFFKR